MIVEKIFSSLTMTTLFVLMLIFIFDYFELKKDTFFYLPFFYAIILFVAFQLERFSFDKKGLKDRLHKSPCYEVQISFSLDTNELNSILDTSKKPCVVSHYRTIFISSDIFLDFFYFNNFIFLNEELVGFNSSDSLNKSFPSKLDEAGSRSYFLNSNSMLRIFFEWNHANICCRISENIRPSDSDIMLFDIPLDHFFNFINTLFDEDFFDSKKIYLYSEFKSSLSNLNCSVKKYSQNYLSFCFSLEECFDLNINLTKKDNPLVSFFS